MTSSVIAFIFMCLFVGYQSPFAIPPKIGQGLSHTFKSADQEFKRRVAEEYGSIKQVDAFVARLKEDGFRVNESSKIAGFTRPGFPCELEWFIRWQEKDGLVTDLFALYGATCL